MKQDVISLKKEQFNRYRLIQEAIKQNVNNKYLESIDPNDVTGNLADIQAVLNETEEESEAAEETEPTENEEV